MFVSLSLLACLVFSRLSFLPTSGHLSPSLSLCFLCGFISCDFLLSGSPLPYPAGALLVRSLSSSSYLLLHIRSRLTNPYIYLSLYVVVHTYFSAQAYGSTFVFFSFLTRRAEAVGSDLEEAIRKEQRDGLQRIHEEIQGRHSPTTPPRTAERDTSNSNVYLYTHMHSYTFLCYVL